MLDTATETNTDNAPSNKFVIVAAVLLIAAAVIGYLYFFPSRSPMLPALTSAEQGDFTMAAARAQELLQRANPGSDEYKVAQSVVEASSYFSNTGGGDVEAVRLAKQQYMASSATPLEKALSVNRLIDYANVARETAVVNEIFSGEPFASMRVEGNTGASLKALAEHSISLTETSGGHFALANWHAAQVLASVGGAKKLTASERKVHTEAIVSALASADALYGAERAAQIKLAFGYFYDAKFFFSEGELYGALALVDKQHLAKSEEYFNKVLTHFEMTRDEKGNTLPILEPRLPYAYLNSAVVINEVSGKARSADVQKQLGSLVALVAAHPETHQGFFVAYVKALSARQASTALASHARIAKLAALDPAFKQFLTANGWVF